MRTTSLDQKEIEFKELLKEQGIRSINQLLVFLSNESLEANPRHICLEYLRHELAKQADSIPVLNNSIQVGNYLADKYSELDHEELHILLVSNNNRIISDELIAMGGITRATVDVRSIFKKAVAKSAVSMFICHNHPSGELTPSDHDINMTQELVRACKIFNINLLDHFIVGNGEYLSMRERDII